MAPGRSKARDRKFFIETGREGCWRWRIRFPRGGAALVEGKMEDKGVGVGPWTSGAPILGTLEESS